MSVNDGTQMDQPSSREAIVSWLVGRFAFYLERPAEEILPDTPLVDLGLDSLYAFSVAGEIEEQFDLDVPATLAWDYPTTNAIAGYLADALETAHG
jgi:acyl carrier protein